MAAAPQPEGGQPRPRPFPAFDEPLRAAMSARPRCSSPRSMHGDRSILDFLDSDYTYLNERLARHYGIARGQGRAVPPGQAQGPAARRPAHPGEHLDGHVEPDADLAGEAGQVGARADPGHASAAAAARCSRRSTRTRKRSRRRSLRQRMEQHRAKPSCATCHSRMDPLGFGLENYDAVGAWRDKEGSFPIDASGTLPSGESFRGPEQLKAILKSRSNEFARCLTEKMLTYALGRGLEDYDHCAVDKIVERLVAGKYRFSALVLGIVESDPFLKRRG